MDQIRSVFGSDWDFEAIPSVGRSGGIALLWRRDRIKVQGVWSNKQVLFGVVQASSSMPWILAAVYASNDGVGTKVLWQQLSMVLELRAPCCFIGDHNVIFCGNEKKAGSVDSP